MLTLKVKRHGTRTFWVTLEGRWNEKDISVLLSCSTTVQVDETLDKLTRMMAARTAAAKLYAFAVDPLRKSLIPAVEQMLRHGLERSLGATYGAVTTVTARASGEDLFLDVQNSDTIAKPNDQQPSS